MKRTVINKLKAFNTRQNNRYRRWFAEGKKDGMCGLCRDLSAVPKLFREAYEKGHAYGGLSREAAAGELSMRMY